MLSELPTYSPFFSLMLKGVCISVTPSLQLADITDIDISNLDTG